MIKAMVLLLRQDFVSDISKKIAEHGELLYLGGFVSMAVSVPLLLFHNIWVMDWPVAITILAWTFFIEGIAILFFPRHVVNMLNLFQDSRTYTVWAVLTLLVGAFLLIKGFGA